jgi:hypothetical protein
MTLMRRAGLCALVCAACGAAAAQGVYKWTDERGQVHYGDKPPAGASAQPVEVAPSPPAPVKSPYEDVIRQQQLQEATEAKEKLRRRREQARAEERKRAEEKRDREKCLSYTRRLDDVQETLRRGYSASREGKLKRQLAQYEEGVKLFCR